MKKLLALLLLSGLARADGIDWQAWEGAQERARTEHRLVVLDLEAVWCHWCHVMDKTTYSDPRVIELLNRVAVPVKVDQDARPDLGHRYEDYGWPATIIFDHQGNELARLSGYVEPDRMVAIVTKLSADPRPLDSVTPPPPAQASGDLDLEGLERRHFNLYDQERAGWGRIHKFVNGPVVEYCLDRSLAGDERNRAMARRTLDANLALLDPVWGGVYQYSDSAVWNSPHYEKIMSTQVANLRVYSLAYAQFGDPRYLQAAQAIVAYLETFLSDPSGGFYVSQDADLQQGQKATDYFALDDAGRRARGIPRIDRHLYARETGWAVEALTLYAGIASDQAALERALAGANWLVTNRAYEGGFSHDGQGLYLGDNLACASAFLTLYRATADPVWLERASATADFIEVRFTRPDHDGYYTSTEGQTRQNKENVALARFANLLYHHTGRPAHQAMARRALAYFAIEGVTDGFNPGGLLLAAAEKARDPLHITVVSSPDSPEGQALFARAQASPSTYLRLDWWHPGTPLPPNTDTEYPDLGKAAAFVCTAGRCSPPIFTPEALSRRL
ncbi:MAG: thioredoxin domain-containing protein [Candidatus Eremiobacteraeota bacterium]|nr:thioredoxin domain-containing protein [Candidatus Eremiobacteraeota bacterium]